MNSIMKKILITLVSSLILSYIIASLNDMSKMSAMEIKVDSIGSMFRDMKEDLKYIRSRVDTLSTEKKHQR